MSEVTIVGGGMIGVCAAIALQAEGMAVELIDRGDLRAQASFGNCGLLAVGEVVPISKPGTLRKIPGWLRDPEGPLHVRPGAVMRHMGWLLRFLAAGRRSKAEAIAAGLAPLTLRAERDTRALFAVAGIADNLVPAENLMVFDAKADVDADSFSWDLRRRLGFQHEALSRDEVRQMEPALGGPIGFGLLLRGWLQFSEPGRVVERLRDAFVARGGTLRTGTVDRIEQAGGKATALRLADGTSLPVQRLVLAAGAWGGSLARDLGLRLPLAALRGYHHHIPTPGVTLNRAVLWANGGFVMTPMETGLRIAGTIEVSALESAPDYRRASVIARKAQRVLPGLDISGATQWAGPRPFMPDTLPVIGHAPHHDNVVLALGHGQVGMTLGATTAALVADLVRGRSPALDLSPYRPNRF